MSRRFIGWPVSEGISSKSFGDEPSCHDQASDMMSGSSSSLVSVATCASWSRNLLLLVVGSAIDEDDIELRSGQHTGGDSGPGSRSAMHPEFTVGNVVKMIEEFV